MKDLDPIEQSSVEKVAEKFYETVMTIGECIFCTELFNSDELFESAVIQAYEDGWRVISSESFNRTGLACPKCAKGE
tara:strand:- start:354 stop:584 length:231 start_codon:yes stop_codon:yes gene_type:complete